MENTLPAIQLGQKVLTGGRLTMEESLVLAAMPDNDLPLLLAIADKIRQTFVGNAVDLCSIINGRSGMCSENCAFCAQSTYHKAEIQVYPLMSEDAIIAAAKEAEAGGALRFAIVTSGRGMEQDREFPQILNALRRIKKETCLRVCCSLGTLSLENALAIKEAGVSRYHHNLETCRSYYSAICTTHSYDDRVKTIKAAKEAGLEICAGGIIGLGESMKQRLQMAFELRELQVDSVPLNILNPIKGTGLANQPPLPPMEILKTFALFRFILPDRGLRTAGGREVNLRDLQAMALKSGINGMMIGGYLTTGGRDCDKDLQMIRDLGLQPLSACEVNPHVYPDTLDN